MPFFSRCLEINALAENESLLEIAASVIPVDIFTKRKEPPERPEGPRSEEANESEDIDEKLKREKLIKWFVEKYPFEVSTASYSANSVNSYLFASCSPDDLVNALMQVAKRNFWFSDLSRDFYFVFQPMQS